MSTAHSIHVKFSPEERQREVMDLLVRADYGMDVYRTFLTPYIGGKTLKTGYAYLSPLRTEKVPSFNLFRSNRDQTIWYMDQASGGGNALTFIMRLFKCDFREAIRKLRSEVLNLPPEPDAIERLGNYVLGAAPPPRPPEPEYPKTLTPLFREDNFYAGSWAAQDEKYYPAHIFGRDVLADYHCRPLGGYHYRYAHPDRQKARDFRVGADWYINQGMYNYAFGERHKIVRPYTGPGKDGRPRKWTSTTRRELDLFGAHLLPKPGEPKLPAVCLLAGNRDTMAFKQLTGVVAVASTAEGHLPTDEQIQLLRDTSERQFVLYDDDKTGRKFQAVLSDDWQHPGYANWLDNHREQAGRRFGFHGGLNTLLTHYQQNDLTALLSATPVLHHAAIATWLRQAMGLI